MIKTIQFENQETEVAQTTNNTSINLEGAKGFACVVEATVTTPSAKTFESGVKASKIIQDLTYLADLADDSGNDITVRYVAPSSGTNALSVAVVANAITVNLQSTAVVAATAVLDITADITLTSVATGTARNTNTFTLQVVAAAANPTNTILVAFTGTAAAIVCTVTPNDGTNNAPTPVDLTTAQLRELITTGAVVGKTVTITDASSFRILQTATGGGATALVDAGEGDGVVATFANGAAFSVAISTADAIKTAVDANAPASALISVTVTGTGSTVQIAQVATALEGGIDPELDVDANTITIPSHGLEVGLKGQLTTTGTLPTGLATTTDYFVIAVDENTIKLASSLVNANAGSAVNITADGTASAVHTFTSTSIAGGSVKLQSSLDEVAWFDISGTSNNITITANFNVLEKVDPMYKFVRAVYTMSAGQISAKTKFLLKNEDN